MTMNNTFTIEHNGTTVHCELSPCSWMYPTYGTQITLGLRPNAAGAAKEFVCNKNLPRELLHDDAEQMALAQQMARNWLEDNGIESLGAKARDWEERSAALLAEIESAQKQQRILDARQMAAYKARGFTHKVICVIHPKDGGDDYLKIAFTTGEPTKRTLGNLLRPSAIKTDYTITTL